MQREQFDIIRRDLDKKMIFLTGPRQVGKTTLAKSFLSLWPDLQYFNYDSDEDRHILLKKTWNKKTPLLVFDEIHKYKKWKPWIKGIYDTQKIPPRLLVTGSARLDVYRKGGDSLAGRYFLHRLYPLSVRELKGTAKPFDILSRLMVLGGFPEPYLGGSEEEAKRWRKTHLDRIIREDLRDLEAVRDIHSISLLVELLRQRVGSTISYSSLAEDLQVSPHTIKKWIQILENLYVIFSVKSYHKNIARAVLKEPKIYFYDTGAVIGDDGARLENAVANCLLKHLHFLEDTKGYDVALHYIRDKEKREVDFVVVEERKLKYLIEVKLSDSNLHRSLLYYNQKLKPEAAIQLVHQIEKTQNAENIAITEAATWLSNLAS